MRSHARVAVMAAVVSLGGIASAEACDKGRDVCSFSLFNNTSYELENFWASPARISNWENDILGRGTLKAASFCAV